MNHGFIRVAAAIPEVMVADCVSNATHIENLMLQAEAKGVEIICFPELSMTGYSCGDLFHQQILIEEAELALGRLLQQTEKLHLVGIVGVPVVVEDKLYNTAVVFQKGIILGVIPKTYLPNYAEFSEKRWFTSSQEADSDFVFLCGQEAPFSSHVIFEGKVDNSPVRFGIEICEDLWVPSQPGSRLSMQGAHLIFNLSACDELVGISDYVKSMVIQQSARCYSGYVYVSAGYGESTTDTVFSGNAYITESGNLLAESKRFSLSEQLIVSDIDVDILKADRIRKTSFAEGSDRNESAFMVPFTIEQNVFSLLRTISPSPLIPERIEQNKRLEEAFLIQSFGLLKRMRHTHANSLVVGISGGLDSTLALLVCVKVCDLLLLPRTTILGITMPGFGTTDRTYINALSLMHSLGVTVGEISIREACELHFRDIDQDMSMHDATYENAQARERTQILMDIANQQNGLVVGTGDMSELALGWATYNGDHMSMYAVNAGIPKTLIRYIVRWVADTQVDKISQVTLYDVLDTPISPELLPAANDGTINQKTEDLVGPYELHDFFLYYLLRYGFRPKKIYFLAQQAFNGKYSDAILKKWLCVFVRRFFTQQFKRSCMPDGPKVLSIGLSPRGDWRMPSDALSALWIREAEAL